MADLLARLAAVAQGGPTLAVARPRARFERRAGSAGTEPWLHEDLVEAHRSQAPVPRPGPTAAPVSAPPWAGPPTSEPASPAASPTAGTRPVTEARTEPGAGGGTRRPEPRPGRVDASTAVPVAKPEPAGRPAAVTTPGPAAEVRTIVERDRVHEVATVERIESSSLVELIRWIDAAPAPPAHRAAAPSPAAEARPDDRPAGVPGPSPAAVPGSAEAGGADAAVVAPAEPLPPRVTVAIERLEIRTPEARPSPPAQPPRPPSGLHFAGPTLDEFLGGPR